MPEDYPANAGFSFTYNGKYLHLRITVAIEVTLPTFLGSAILDGVNKAQLSATDPTQLNARDAYNPLTDAATARAKALGSPDAEPLLIARQEYVPAPGDKVDTTKAASVRRAKTKDGREAHLIGINPNIDRSFYAHELGHAVSQKNKIGRFINDARGTIARNPVLARTIAGSFAFGAPAIAAGLQEGDDDLAGSIGLAAALASPTLIDEALASKNALAVMKDAGMPATAGQRGRLAGAYLSYLAPVLLAGSVGNALGNAVDEHTALYDL